MSQDVHDFRGTMRGMICIVENGLNPRLHLLFFIQGFNSRNRLFVYVFGLKSTNELEIVYR